MITSKQLQIISTISKTPFAEYTRTEIKQKAHEKSNNALNRALHQLKKDEIINERKIGRSSLWTLNLDNNKTYAYITLCNSEKMVKIKTILNKIKKEIKDITPFYSLVIFGSYSLNQQTPSSDLDIAIFIENETQRKPIEAAMENAKLKTILEIDSHVIPRNEMIEMLTNNEENLGKQIAKKHCAIHNVHIFYDIIKEGIRHGFHL